MKKILSVLLALTFVFGLSTSVFAAKENFTVVTSVDVTEVSTPVTDTAPLYSAKVTTNYCKIADTNNATWKNGVAWFEKTAPDQSGRQMQVGEKFKAGYYYMVRVSVDTTTSFKMESGGRYADVTGTVNGHTATSVYGTSNDNVYVDYLFPNMCQKTLTEIALTVPTPADGAKPSFDKISGDGFYSDNASNPVAIYKNGIAWYKSASSYIAPGTTETFKAETEYTVKISLVPESSAVFSTSLKATVNGKTATVERFGNSSITVIATLTAPAKNHTHTPSQWQFDDLDHWKICTDPSCGAIVSEKQMHYNSDADGKCDTCLYQLPIEVPEQTVGTTTPDTTQTPEPTQTPENTEISENSEVKEKTEEAEKPLPTTTKKADEAKEKDASFPWVIVCAVLLLAVAGVAAFIVVKKNKGAK